MIVIRMDIKTRRFPIPFSVKPILGKIMGGELICYIDKISYPSKANLLLAAKDRTTLIHELDTLFQAEEFDTVRFKKLDLYDMTEVDDGESLEDVLEKLNNENVIRLKRDVVIRSLAPEILEEK